MLQGKGLVEKNSEAVEKWFIQDVVNVGHYSTRFNFVVRTGGKCPMTEEILKSECYQSTKWIVY